MLRCSANNLRISPSRSSSGVIGFSSELLEQPCLAALVVRSRGAERYRHHRRGVLDGHVVIEDELQYLSLPRRQLAQRGEKSLLPLRNLEGRVRASSSIR